MSTKAITRGSADRISNLPCTVIEHILTCLPLYDAVRTCVLSKQWRYKWLSIPHLVFDEHFVKSLKGAIFPELVIYHVLHAHRGHLVKFSLECTKYDIRYALTHWLYMLSHRRHRVKDLTLKLWRDPRYLVPSFLFELKYLTRLHLSYCEIKLPSTFKGFSSLVRLDLINVRNVFRVLNAMIEKCPMLKVLNIENVVDAKCLGLNITSPTIKSFHFCGIFNSISFKNSSMEDVEIFYCDETMLENNNVGSVELLKSHGCHGNLIEVFGQLPSVKTLATSSLFMKFLAMGDVPDRLPYNLNHLTLLQLYRINIGLLDIVSCGLCLIRSSPNLRSLEITCDGHGGKRAAGIKYLKEQQKLVASVPLSYNLKCAKILGFDVFLDCEVTMEFLKLLLLGCPELKRIEISRYEADDYSERLHLQMVKDLRGLYSMASSSQVEIIFN